eukprot:UN33028
MLHLVFLLVWSSYAAECDVGFLKENIPSTLGEYDIMCNNSFEKWGEEMYFDGNDENQCGCLAGLSTKKTTELSCEITYMNGSENNERELLDLIDIKHDCEKKYCLDNDNISSFCYCNSDDLINEWNLIDSNNKNNNVNNDISAKKLCVEMMVNSHDTIPSPTIEDCACFYEWSGALNLGCRIDPENFTKKWSVWPELAVTAQACLDKNFDYAEYWKEDSNDSQIIL